MGTMETRTCSSMTSSFTWTTTVVASAADAGDEISPAGQKFLDHQWRTVTQDFFIWENMKTLHTPNFTPEEAKYYAKLRRWAWQFYPRADR